MSISRRKLKNRFKNKMTLYFDDVMAIYKLLSTVHGNDFDTLIEIELCKPRIRKKMKESFDYDNIEPMFSMWSVPICVTNKSKRSRIKNFCTSYKIVNADEIMKPNGEPYHHIELMNYYLAKGGIDEI